MLNAPSDAVNAAVSPQIRLYRAFEPKCRSDRPSNGRRRARGACSDSYRRAVSKRVHRTAPRLRHASNHQRTHYGAAESVGTQSGGRRGQRVAGPSAFVMLSGFC
jgi:hypothetical protein